MPSLDVQGHRRVVHYRRRKCRATVTYTLNAQAWSDPDLLYAVDRGPERGDDRLPVRPGEIDFYSSARNCSLWIPAGLSSWLAAGVGEALLLRRL